MTDKKFMTARAFANKIQWEGGVIPAFDYGLHYTDLDPTDDASAELREAWKSLELVYEDVVPLIDEIDCIIEDLPGEWED